MSRDDLPGQLPPTAKYAFGFSFCNALSFQIALNAPLILYAKSLGATATLLGILAALNPFFNLGQLATARFMGRWGYKKFVLAGWSLRTFCIAALALLPIVPGLDAGRRLAVVLALQIGFNLLRGLSAGAWLPWIAAWIHPAARGLYIGRDQQQMYAGSFAAMTLAAVTLGAHASPGRFAAMFAVSAVAGWASLFFLGRIPDAASAEVLARSAHPVPWKAIIGYRPFARLLFFNALFAFALGGMGPFTVSYLRAEHGLAENAILYMSAAGFVLAMLVLPPVGRLLDRHGSKPLLVASMGGLALIGLGWVALAALAPRGSVVAPALLIVAGTGSGSIFGAANARLTLGTMPQMGRNHFFALFTVLASIALAFAPIFWGTFLDFLKTHPLPFAQGTAGRYGVYFFLSACLTAIAALYAGRLEEKAPTEDPAGSAVTAAVKRFARFWQR